jgi:hypothetical protein
VNALYRATAFDSGRFTKPLRGTSGLHLQGLSLNPELLARRCRATSTTSTFGLYAKRSLHSRSAFDSPVLRPIEVTTTRERVCVPGGDKDEFFSRPHHP